MASSPAIDAGGTAYFGSYDNYIYAVEKDGRLKWRFKTDAEISSSPAIGADGTVYVGSKDHGLYAIDSKSAGYQSDSPWPGSHFNRGNGHYQITNAP